MSKSSSAQAHLEEEKLGLRLVKERLITDGQLNTALDFQRAVGGKLEQVVMRLGFVDPSALKKFLEDFEPSRLGKEAAHPENTQPQYQKSFLKDQEDSQKGKSWDLEKTVTTPPDLEKTVTTPPFMVGKPEKQGALASASSEPAGASEVPNEPQATGSSETGIVLEALLRVLVRKGVIDRSELKEEICRL